MNVEQQQGFEFYHRYEYDIALQQGKIKREFNFYKVQEPYLFTPRARGSSEAL
jgi:hypothetical protein